MCARVLLCIRASNTRVATKSIVSIYSSSPTDRTLYYPRVPSSHTSVLHLGCSRFCAVPTYTFSSVLHGMEGGQEEKEELQKKILQKKKKKNKKKERRKEGMKEGRMEGMGQGLTEGQKDG